MYKKPDFFHRFINVLFAWQPQVVFASNYAFNNTCYFASRSNTRTAKTC
jgi:hypothetical protein